MVELPLSPHNLQDGTMTSCSKVGLGEYECQLDEEDRGWWGGRVNHSTLRLTFYYNCVSFAELES